MSGLPFDLGIHYKDVCEHLNSSGVIKIVGYVRSGKSTLAEILRDELEKNNKTVLLQNATKWVLGQSSDSFTSADAASIDPEIAEAISKLEATANSCWIIDDAEVMLAYASETILKSLSKKLQLGLFSVILIRNRFINERSGWFQNRESLIHPQMPECCLAPLKSNLALDAALSFYNGSSAMFKATWLVQMSGGIPGLMAELAPFAPDFSSEHSNTFLVRRAFQKKNQILVNNSFRQTILNAINQKILPPVSMLSFEAQVELSALKLYGIIHSDYMWRDDPLCGSFWHLMITEEFSKTEFSSAVFDLALNLAIMIDGEGVTSNFLTSLGTDKTEPEDLSKIFALCLICEQDEKLRPFVKPLNLVLSENLGKLQLTTLLVNKGVRITSSLKGVELADLLIKTAA